MLQTNFENENTDQNETDLQAELPLMLEPVQPVNVSEQEPENTEETVTKKIQSLNHEHRGQAILLLMFMVMAVMIVGKNATDYHASVIPTKNAAPFNGTTLPVLNVPKWTSLTQSEYKLPYESIPASKLIPLPLYDASILASTTESLGWKTERDLNIRNAKITFSVPYMGNYKLDGLENMGSHLAVDIKIPNNTPIYAIANGVVSKVADQSSGFGKHIVIKHEGVPSLTNPNAKTTLYSSYNHLSQILVTEGSVVSKGQMIGKSGNTGTATTPHLHFQIDNDQAPWHPYWPFTFQEYSAAGLSFTDAIDAGLGKEKALLTTINPMTYVQKYLSYGSNHAANSDSMTSVKPIPSSNPQENPPATVVNPISNSTITSPPTKDTSSSSETSPVNSTTVPDTKDSDSEISTNVSMTDKPEKSDLQIATRFRLITESTSFVEEVPKKFTIEAIDSGNTVVTTYQPKDEVYFEVMSGAADMPNKLEKSNFKEGVAEFTITPHTTYGLKIKAYDGNISGESKMLQGSLFSDIDESSPSYKAVSFLKKYKVLGGYPDGSFKPDNIVSRVESVKFIIEGINEKLQDGSKLPFKDTKIVEWYSDYVATAYQKSIVKGYPDKTFKPSNTVNRAEFLKMLLTSMNFKLNPFVTRDVYNDVDKDSWYAQYVKFAKDKDLMDARGNYFKPEEGMTREEVAVLLYRAVMLKITGADKYSDDLKASSSQMEKYFN